MVTRVALAVVACLLLLVGQASAACSSMQMAAEIKQYLKEDSDVTIKAGEVTDVDGAGPITPEEVKMMDSVRTTGSSRAL